MYAQLIQLATSLPCHTELDRIVTTELVPALLAQTGFAGTLGLVDRESGDAVVIVLWETAEQAARSLDDYGESSLAAPTSDARVSVWEVTARV